MSFTLLHFEAVVVESQRIELISESDTLLSKVNGLLDSNHGVI